MRRAATIFTTVAIVVVCAASLSGCKKQAAETTPDPRVSVERPTRRAAERGDWATTVYPARYERAELPTFPDEAVAAEVAHATVRADFTVLADGRAHEVKLTLEVEVPEGERFVTACADVLASWRFSPAWRLARADERRSTSVVLVPSKAHLIFHFDLGAHLEGGDVEMSFAPGG